MKYIIYSTLIILIGCTEKKSNDTLFLKFNSGILKEEFIMEAKNNTSLTVVDEGFPEYEYNFYLKASSVKANLRAIFHEQSNKLYKIYIFGKTRNSAELEEIENMFIEKYKTPKKSMEITNITIPKSLCSTWPIGNKEIRYCTDSFPDHFSNTNNQIFCFEIYYTDLKIENENLNSRTKDDL